MKKVAIILAFLLIIAVPLEVSAATWTLRATPSLSFDGTTANCSTIVIGNKTTDHLKVTMKLVLGNRHIAVWTTEGYGYVAMSETASVNTGRTYRLIIEVIENGVAKDPVSVSGST